MIYFLQVFVEQPDIPEMFIVWFLEDEEVLVVGSGMDPLQEILPVSYFHRSYLMSRDVTLMLLGQE